MAARRRSTPRTTAGIPSTVDVTLGCDAASQQCYALVNARAAQTVAVLQDDNFSSKVARHSLSLVKLSDVAYTIPSNTLTFDIPQADVYAGPAGSTRETDPGVALLGTTQPIKAGTPTTETQHMTIDDDAPARPVIEHAVENKQDFVFIVVASPRMNAGNPVPAGSIQIDRLAEAGGRALDVRAADDTRRAGHRRGGGGGIDASRSARSAGVRLLLRCALVASLIGGCAADVFDVDVALTARTFVADFGSQTGTIPTVTCTDEVAQQVCGSSASVSVDTSAATGVPSDVQVDLGATRVRASASRRPARICRSRSTSCRMTPSSRASSATRCRSSSWSTSPTPSRPTR